MNDDHEEMTPEEYEAALAEYRRLTKQIENMSADERRELDESVARTKARLRLHTRKGEPVAAGSIEVPAWIKAVSGERLRAADHVATLEVRCDYISIGELFRADVKNLGNSIEPGSYRVSFAFDSTPVVWRSLQTGAIIKTAPAIRYVVVHFGDHPVAKWEYAGGFSVDGGGGSVGDLEAAKIAAERKKWPEQIERDGWASFRVAEAQGASVIVFPCSLGDGWYDAFWGYDAAEAAQWLIIDLSVCS